jgi:hypothetical protein
MSALAIDVLSAIYAAGGTVRIADEDRLKVSAPVPLPSALMDRLRAVKPDVRSLLTALAVDQPTDAAPHCRYLPIETDDLVRHRGSIMR